MRRGKIDISVILILLFTSSPFLAQAQEDTSSVVDYFPLNIGDERQYYYIIDDDTLLTPVSYVSDTVTIEGHRYYLYESLLYDYFGSDYMYVRSDSSGDILRYNDYDSVETVWFNFNLSESDTYSLNYGWEAIFLYQNIDVNIRAGQFHNGILLKFHIPGVADAGYYYLFAPNVGIVATFSDYWADPIYDLYRAVINGIYYPPESVDIEANINIPLTFTLSQPHPNPFNPQTTIEFSIPQSGTITLTMYNVLGREVETILNQHMQPGHHKLHWNASNVPSGIYFVRMESRSFSQVRKVMVVR